MIKRCNGVKLSQMEELIPAVKVHAFAVSGRNEIKPGNVVVIDIFSGRGDKDLNTYIDYFKL
jgi:tryptophan synthase beta chain